MSAGTMTDSASTTHASVGAFRFKFALLASLGGVFASVLGKLATDPKPTFLSAAACAALFEPIGQPCTAVHPETGAATPYSYAMTAIKAACFVAMFMANTLMMSFFAKSLEIVGSLQATVVNCGASFALTVRIPPPLLFEMEQTV